jgi:hypothetical protein
MQPGLTGRVRAWGGLVVVAGLVDERQGVPQ